MDREKVIKELEEYRDREFVKEGITVFDNDPRYRKLIIGNALALLKEQETKTGEWIKKQPKYPSATGGSRTAFCSLCGDWGRKSFKFCPHCGAKMET